MTTGVWNGTVGPNFGHSDAQESLLTPRQRHTRELTHKGRSEVVINVGFQYLSLSLQSRDCPWNPWDVKVSRVYKCLNGGESKSREYGWRGERVESASVNLVRRISIKGSDETTDTSWGVEKWCYPARLPDSSQHLKRPQEFSRSDRNKPIMSGSLRRDHTWSNVRYR
jgi:hypothetical protein